MTDQTHNIQKMVSGVKSEVEGAVDSIGQLKEQVTEMADIIRNIQSQINDL